jgi:hypothetical protein
MCAMLILTPSRPPAERSFAPLAGAAGMPEAIAAAKAGDLALLDRIELAWLNARGPKPTIEPHHIPEDLCGPDLVPMAMDICRGAGPRGETLVEWGMVRPCPNCWRRLLRRDRCHKCSSAGHLSDVWGSVYADLDGNVLEAQ